MKHGRIIKLEKPCLQKIRSNFRKILLHSVFDSWNSLREERKQLMYLDTLSDLQKKKKKEVKKSIKFYYHLSESSICRCKSRGGCVSKIKTYESIENEFDFYSNLNMVYDAYEDAWYCEACFNKIRQNLKPQNWFNEGIIVKKKAEKPCYVLNWCCYGSLVECFLIRREELGYTCLAFGHDCPVFYVSENISEQSKESTPTRMKLKHSLKNCPQFNEKEIIDPNRKKPCYVLGWCPYGSMGDTFQIRQTKKKQACTVFAHDCPAFYNAENVTEKKD